MKEMTFDARLSNLDAVQEFVHTELDLTDCSMKASMQIDMAVEELFVNIAHYAYGEGKGTAVIRCGMNEADGAFEITLSDSGIPYNPLAKEDADTTLSAEERQIGGLGILMVKRTMDIFRYRYEDGRNITTIGKKL